MNALRSGQQKEIEKKKAIHDCLQFHALEFAKLVYFL